MEQFLYFGVFTACLISVCAAFYIRYLGFILPSWIVMQFSFLLSVINLKDYSPKAVTGIGAVLLLVVSLGLLYVALFGRTYNLRGESCIGKPRKEHTRC